MEYTVVFKENAAAFLMTMLSIFVLVSWVMIGYPSVALDSTTVSTVALIYLIFLIFTFIGYIIKYIVPEAPGAVVDFGAPERAWINIALGGLLGTFVAVSLLAGAVAKITLTPFTVTLPVQFLMVALVAPFIEELFFRGWLLPTLSQYLSAPLGLILSSLLFTFYHVNTWGTAGLIGYIVPFLFSLILSLTVLKFESITPAIIGHMTANLIIVLTQMQAMMVIL